MALPSAEGAFAGDEAELLLCCARIALTPRERARVIQLAGTGLDWDAVIALAEVHGLLPLLHRHLSEAAARIVPRAVAVELWGRHEATARRNRAMTQELFSILATLDAIGITALPYKGPALAFSLYGDVALREFGDLDILIRARDVLRAKAALQARGYVADYPLAADAETAFLRAPSQYHLVLTGPGDTLVELHWKTDPEFPVERDDDAWWAALEHAPLESGTVQSFAARELLWVLCLHGSKHWWASLGWLVDVAELIRQQPAQDWDWLLSRARRVGCERRLALGLHLAQGLLGAPLPEAVRDTVAAHPGVAKLARRVRETLLSRDAQLDAWQGLGMNLSLYERTPQRFAHLVNTLWAPSLVEWTRWPLPRALFFLYPPLRLLRLTRKHLARSLQRG
jgi:hypothetical protein